MFANAACVLLPPRFQEIYSRCLNAISGDFFLNPFGVVCSRSRSSFSQGVLRSYLLQGECDEGYPSCLYVD